MDLYKPKKDNLEVYDDKKRELIAELSGLNEYQKIRCSDYTRQNNNLSYKDWVTGGTIAHNIVGMFYNIYQANKLKCEYEKEKLTLDFDLVVSNMQITLDETQVRYQVEIDSRDREIENLRDIIKKNKKLNIPMVIATSAVVGFGAGFGAYHLASK